MFAGLKQYGEGSFFRENPVIQIFYRGKWVECPVFHVRSAIRAMPEPTALTLWKKSGCLILRRWGAASLYETGITPGGDEKLITLSTCYGKDQYLIVQALLRGTVTSVQVFFRGC